MRWLFLIALLFIATSTAAQESQFRADLRREGERLAAACDELSVKAVSGCAIEVATGHPFHVALGSLAPQNGFGVGLAFVEHYTPNERWRLSWNADAVAALSGSWRAGAYMKITHTPVEAPIVVRRGAAPPPAGSIGIHEYPVVNVFTQATSLHTLFIFEPARAGAAEPAKSVFDERQTMVGVNAIVLLTKIEAFQGVRPSVIGGITARIVTVGGNTFEAAPGLADQPVFTQLEEGIRLKPSPASGRIRMNYLFDFQQFLAKSASRSSFHRWTVDLKHEIPLYRTVSSSGPTETNGPDECFQAVGSTSCPPLSTSRNREGSVGFRLLTISSGAAAGNRVPFYFQPTLGGSDINGERLLSSYEDYRFRGPHLLALQESVEHSIWGPLGVRFVAEQGKVALQHGDLDFQDLAHSFAAGLTIRAGGFPVVNLSFAWGGGGHHAIATMDSSLLGGSRRPSLY